MPASSRALREAVMAAVSVPSTRGPVVQRRQATSDDAPSALGVLRDQRTRRVEQLLAVEVALVHLGDPFVVDRLRDLDELLRLGVAQGVDRVAAVDRRLLADRVVA